MMNFALVVCLSSSLPRAFLVPDYMNLLLGLLVGNELLYSQIYI